jgi:hypothetical protein
MKRITLLFALTLLAGASASAQQSIKAGGGEVSVSRTGQTTVKSRSDKAVEIQSPTNITGATAVTGAVTVSSTLGVTGAASAASLNLGGATLLDVLTATASLNFGATAAGACDALTITVTGAADGDAVVLGVPVALMSASEYQTIQGFVSAANTVTVKRCNLTNATTPLSDPAAATVRATVLKF